MRFLRSLNGILAYSPTVPAVNALWRIFLMRFGRSPSGILAFVRRRRLFLIKSSYKRTKLVFVRLEIDRQGNLSVCVCFSKSDSLSKNTFSTS